MRCGLFMLVMAAALQVFAVPDDRFLGGFFDGAAKAVLYQYERDAAPSFTSVRFRGGSYDGHSRGDLIQYDRATAPSWQSVRFSGGAQDGYASVEKRSYDRSASPQWKSIRFTGGVRDGYAAQSIHQYSRAASPQWQSVRFSGGSYDGSDRSIITGISNPLSGDLDADGLPDWWEALYYGSIFKTDAAGDTDFDGMTAWAEYVSGTVPTNGASLFQWLEITAPESSNDWKILRWSSEPDRTYSITAVTDILKNASAVLVTNLPATPPDNVWTNAATDERFEIYKVEVNW